MIYSKVERKMENSLTKKTRFFQRKWFMWIFLIILPPLGLILLWSQRSYSKIKGTFISLFALIYFAFPLALVATAKEPLFKNHNELVSAFDSQKEFLKLSNKMSEVKTDDNVATYHISKDITLVENLNVINQIHEIVMVGQGDGMEITKTLALLISMTNPKLSKAEVGDVLQDLRYFDQDYEYHENETNVELNSIRYNLKYDQKQGVIFSVSKVN